MKKIIFFIIVIVSAAAVTGRGGVRAETAEIPVSADYLVDSADAGGHYACNVYGHIGSWSNNGGQVYRYFADIDLGGTYYNSIEIEYAVVELSRVGASWDNNDEYELYEITEAWDRGALAWNNQPAIGSEPVFPVAGEDGLFYFDVTDMVREWYFDRDKNHGVMIKKRTESAHDEMNKGTFACASYNLGADKRPKLRIYTGGSGPAYLGEEETEGGAGDSGTVIDREPLAKDKAYKAIVKIETYYLNEHYKVTLKSSGSGVIVDPRGIVLTNHHVVTAGKRADGSDIPATSLICLTPVVGAAPDCSYYGKLIAKKAETDIALLKIEKIPELGAADVFDYLEMNKTDAVNANDEVTAFGYPAIGGETITVTKGIVSGKAGKYGQSWIKSDAVTSFGSSGGAGVSERGRLIGITSRAYADMAGSLGYLIDVSSLRSWYNASRVNAPAGSETDDRVLNFIAKKKAAERAVTLRHYYPSFSVTRPADWRFSMADENMIIADKASDEDGGIVMIAFMRLPYAAGTSIVAPAIRREYHALGVLSAVTIIKDEEAKIGGSNAREIILSAGGMQKKIYYVPAGQYLMEVNYDYGLNEKDRKSVEAMINSIKLFPEEETIKEIRDYTGRHPEFGLSAGREWFMLPLNFDSEPLQLAYRPIKEAFFHVGIGGTDENTRDAGNEEYLDFAKQSILDQNTFGGMIDYRVEITAADARHKINGELGDTVMIEYAGKSVSSGETLVRTRVVYVKSGDKYINVALNYYGGSDKGYGEAKAKFGELLGNFTLKPSADSRAPGESAAAPLPAGATAVSNRAMYARLKGMIMLKTEDAGKAYYISPSSEAMYYLGRPADAFAVMRGQGIGIKNADLAKIPIGLGNLTGPDTDGDGLPDIFEDAIGTDKNNPDTDGDGYGDKSELEAGYDPSAVGARMNYDLNFAKNHKGKIFLQVESKGEAWYVNPADGKRYFLGRPADAFGVMRDLGLGISNGDFGKL